MATELKRMVIIGLGGTGMNAALNVKRRLLRQYGEIPPMYKFLMFDTDDFIPQKENGVSVVPTRAEYTKLKVNNPYDLKETEPEIKEWWTAVPQASMKSISSGAKGIRPLGRLSIFANAKEVNETIKQTIKDMSGERIKGLVEGKYEVSDNTLVSIVGSLAGGTGSGTFMDISFVANNALVGADDKLYLYLLLPDAFVGKPFVYNAEENTYGSLKEIDHFLSLDSNAKPWKYKLGGEKIELEGAPWNLAFLVNDTKSNGETIESIEELTEFLGTVIFLSSGATGKKSASMYDNMEGMLPLLPRWFGKKANYCSFGTSELILPRDDVVSAACHKIALGVLDRLSMGGEAETIGADTDNLIDEWQIREDTDDQVIDALCGPTDLKNFSGESEQLNNSGFEELKRAHTKLIDSSKKKLTELCDTNCTELSESLKKKVRTTIAKRINQKGGISYTKALVSSMIGRVEHFQEEMKSEKKDFTEKQESIGHRYKSIDESLESAFGSFLGRSRRVREGFGQFAKLVNAESRILMEIERRDAAIRFFASLLNELNDIDTQLDKLNNYISSLMKELNTQLQSQLNNHRKLRSFQYQLKINDVVDLSTFHKTADEFLLWLKTTKDQEVIDFGDMRLEDLKKILLEFAENQNEIKVLNKLTVENVLKSLDRERLGQIITSFDRKAVPLWNYNKGYIGGNRQTTEFMIFGVQDAEKSIFDQDFLMQHVNTKKKPSIISTDDPLRVICFKGEASLPAFAINHMNSYHDKYFESSKELSFHVDRRWEEEFDDLFPSGEENRRWWSLSLAPCFNLIIKKGSGGIYRIKSEDSGSETDDYWVKLIAGRTEAMNMFLKDSDLVAEIEKRISDINDSVGSVSIYDQLKNYTEELKGNARNSGDKTKAQIDNELKDIREYMSEINPDSLN